MQDLGFKSYTGHHSNTLNMVLFTLSLMIGTAGLPHVIIRFFTVPKVADARWSAGWALVFIALLYLTAPAVGAMARLNLIDTVYPNGVQEESIAYDERPDWMRNWEVTGLLKFEDKNGDGRIQWYNDTSETFAATAAANGWTGSELVVNPSIGTPASARGVAAKAAPVTIKTLRIAATSPHISRDRTARRRGGVMDARLPFGPAATVAAATFSPEGVIVTPSCALPSITQLANALIAKSSPKTSIPNPSNRVYGNKKAYSNALGTYHHVSLAPFWAFPFPSKPFTTFSK